MKGRDMQSMEIYIPPKLRKQLANIRKDVPHIAANKPEPPKKNNKKSKVMSPGDKEFDPLNPSEG